MWSATVSFAQDWCYRQLSHSNPWRYLRPTSGFRTQNPQYIFGVKRKTRRRCRMWRKRMSCIISRVKSLGRLELVYLSLKVVRFESIRFLWVILEWISKGFRSYSIWYDAPAIYIYLRFLSSCRKLCMLALEVSWKGKILLVLDLFPCNKMLYIPHATHASCCLMNSAV